MDKKILRLTLVIAVSLFWGTAFTGCSDEEDTPAAYQLKKEDIRVSQPEGGFAVVIDQLLKVRLKVNQTKESLMCGCWMVLKLLRRKAWSICLKRWENTN